MKLPGLKDAALVSLGTVLGLLALEGGCRLWAPSAALAGFRTRNFPKTDVFRPSRDLPYELAPGIPGFSNSLGYRDRERSIAKGPGVLRTVVLGDSIAMYGSLVDRLQAAFDVEAPGRHEVWNCAIGGHGLREYALMMRGRVGAYRPDQVLIAFCPNDLGWTPVMYRDTEGRLNCYRPLPGLPTAAELWLYRRSHAYRLLLLASTRLRPSLLEPDPLPPAARALDVIQAQAARMGAPLRAAVFPWMKPDEQWTEPERTAHRRLLELLRRRGIPFVDLSEALPSRRRLALRTDELHPNAEGDALAARAVLAFLRDPGLAGAPNSWHPLEMTPPTAAAR